MKLAIFGSALLSYAGLSAALTDTITLSGNSTTELIGTVDLVLINGDSVEVCGFKNNNYDSASGNFGCSPNIMASFSDLTSNSVLITYHSKCGVNVNNVKVPSQNLNCLDCCRDFVPCKCCEATFGSVVGAKNSMS
jgi:hypothetical protein